MEVTMDINTKRTRTTISIVMLIWAVVCIAVTGLYVGNNHAEAATTGTLTSDYVYFRKSPPQKKKTAPPYSQGRVRR